MTRLAGERCQACSGSTPTVTPQELEQLRGELSDDWSVRDGRALRRSFRCQDFVEAFVTATRVALLAEAEGHHPEMTFGWGHVDIELTTHAVGGLTRNDFIFAAKVDALPA